MQKLYLSEVGLFQVGTGCFQTWNLTRAFKLLALYRMQPARHRKQGSNVSLQFEQLPAQAAPAQQVRKDCILGFRVTPRV